MNSESPLDDLNFISNKLFGFFVSGQQYKEAFYILIEHFDVTGKTPNHWIREVERPAYFCAGMAVESFLKCYLGLNNIEIPQVGHSGHNLEFLLSKFKESLKISLNLNESDIDAIKLLNKRYSISSEYGKYELRYFNKPGVRTSPRPDFFNSILNKLESKLRLQFPEKFQC